MRTVLRIALHYNVTRRFNQTQFTIHRLELFRREQQVTGGHDSVETMAEAALALACVGFIGAIMAMFISIRNARHAKAVSNGEFAWLPCL